MDTCLSCALGWCRVLLVCRFAVPAAAAAFTARVRRALELLTAAPGCLGGELGVRSTTRTGGC